jgi:Fusaric acid resistance protein-like
MANRLRRFFAAVIERARERGRKAVVRALQLTGAALAAYLVADQIFPGSRPLLAPLSALLVVQVSLYHTLTAGLQRVASVVAGVVLAVLFSNFLGFTWWTLAAVIGVSLLVGQLLRLREQLLEVPISAMLVMSVGGAERPATTRITETLVGAVVGVLYNLLLPGRVQSDTAGAAVERFAGDMAAFLERMADEVCNGVTLDDAHRWLADTRRLAGRVARADRALVDAEESRKFNVRALGTIDVVPSLRSGLDALEHCVVALRGLCRAVVDQISAFVDDPDHVYSPDAREVFAVLLRDLAAAISAFGRLLHADAEGAASTDRELATAIDTVGEARAKLTEMLMIDPHSDSQLWELNGTVLANVERILREIDLEELTRQRERRRREWESLPPAIQAVDRLRTTSREVAQHPLRWRRRTTPPDAE